MTSSSIQAVIKPLVGLSLVAEAGPAAATLSLHFPKGYIADPYWPAMERVINIEKESGTRRARSEANRAKALEDYLKKIDMDLAEFRALQHKAVRPFYRDGENDHDEIIIPTHQLYACLAQAADEARSATRIATRNQIRSVIKSLTPLYTGKNKADGVYERFVVVTAGTGAKLSNQRSLRKNEYISNFTANLTIGFDDNLVDPKRLQEFLAFAGREVGVGASRKMGWGRFILQ